LLQEPHSVTSQKTPFFNFFIVWQEQRFEIVVHQHWYELIQHVRRHVVSGNIMEKEFTMKTEIKQNLNENGLKFMEDDITKSPPQPQMA
jgi:hypothetical protein